MGEEMPTCQTELYLFFSLSHRCEKNCDLFWDFCHPRYFGNICCVSGDCRNTRSFQQQIFSDVKKRKTPCKCK